MSCYRWATELSNTRMRGRNALVASCRISQQADCRSRASRCDATAIILATHSELSEDGHVAVLKVHVASVVGLTNPAAATFRRSGFRGAWFRKTKDQIGFNTLKNGVRNSQNPCMSIHRCAWAMGTNKTCGTLQKKAFNSL